MNLNYFIHYLESRLELWRDLAAVDIRNGFDTRVSLAVSAELSRAVDYAHSLHRSEMAHLILEEIPALREWAG